MTYEQAFSELEEISTKIASKDIGLEEATKLFERAIELSKICYEKLKQTEGKLLIFQEELDKLEPLSIN